jgi:hypothetical protein
MNVYKGAMRTLVLQFVYFPDVEDKAALIPRTLFGGILTMGTLSFLM